MLISSRQRLVVGLFLLVSTIYVCKILLNSGEKYFTGFQYFFHTQDKIGSTRAVKQRVYDVKLQRGNLSACLNQVTYTHPRSVWTIITNMDGYVQGAIKLLRSIKVNTDYQFDAILIELTTKVIPEPLRGQLITEGWQICRLERIAPRDETKMMFRYRDLFTKLHAWRMTEYQSLIFIDSDCLVINNINHLFEIHNTFNAKNGHMIAVTRDIYDGKWHSEFNVGVFVIKPSFKEYERLLALKNDPKFEFDPSSPEQNFLNVVYRRRWAEIGFVYNANLAVYEQKPTYWRRYEKNIRVIHFTMFKPWNCREPYLPICEKWKRF